MWKLAEDTINADDLAALADWIRTSPRLTQGPLVREFEMAWATWVGSADAVVVSSGTTANFALVEAVMRRVRSSPVRIGVSAVTWATNVTPALLLGAEVVIFDVDPMTLGVDVEQACAAIEAGKIDVLFLTHALGFDALDDRLITAAAAADVILIEDCCESHGAVHGSQKVGTLGLGGTFSFYFGHHMSTIEGGVVVTDDLELADDIRLMRAHGLARESSHFDEYAAANPTIHPQFLFVSTGLNLRSSDLNAFLGLRQLTQLDDRIARRNRNAELFLAGLPSGYWREFRTLGMSSFALPIIPHLGRNFDHVLDQLGAEYRPVIAGNLLRQPFLREHAERITAMPTPNADHLHHWGRYVGNGHHVDERMVAELLTALASG